MLSTAVNDSTILCCFKWWYVLLSKTAVLIGYLMHFNFVWCCVHSISGSEQPSLNIRRSRHAYGTVVTTVNIKTLNLQNGKSENINPVKLNLHMCGNT